MPVPGITVESIVKDNEDLNLQFLAGLTGSSNRIGNAEINRPGLSLTGFFDFFANDRIQVFGKGEWAYLNSLPEERLIEITNKFYQFHLNCIVFTHGNEPPSLFVEKSNEKGIPLLGSKLATHRFTTIISQVLDRALAPRTMRHGVLIEVFGVGTLLTGRSGVGKSETALELIERGHRLVADDMVEIRRLSESYLIGSCSDLLRHHMEIRGLGILNIKDLFGVGSVRDHKLIELIISLKEWEEHGDYERTGIEARTEEILAVSIPYVEIPVKPGRNIPIIVETAAMNQRLKKMGKNSAKEFSNKLTNYIEHKNSLETNILKNK
jgi:HPr kinase/phosphorylase